MTPTVQRHFSPDERPTHYAGSEWLARQLKHHAPDAQLSPLGAKVADILGEVGRGIYHYDWVTSKTNLPEWSRQTCISLCAGRGFLCLSSIDSADLTQLVFLAHDYGIRVEIRPRGFRYLTMMFHQRERRDFSMEGHPTLEQAVERHRSRYPVAVTP